MCVGEFEAIQLMQHMAKRLQRIGIVHVVEDAPRREADSHSISAPHLCHGVGHVQRQPGAVAHGPAVFVGALVCAIAEKLVEQIAIGIMDFYAVETGRFRVARRDGILHHDARQLLPGQRPWRDVRLHSAFRQHLAGARSDGAGRNGQCAIHLKTWMRDAAHMPEL